MNNDPSGLYRRLGVDPSAPPEAITAAFRRKPKELIIVEADQGRFENAGECEVIVRRYRRPARGDEVHHRDVVA